MDLDFLEKLVSTPSPSGFEQPVQELVRNRFKNFADEIKTDVHGNVIGIRNPEGEPRIMIAAHCDEIGFMVKHITDEGYIYFGQIGGVDASLLPGHHVEIHTANGIISGVIGKKPIHFMEEEDKRKKHEIHTFAIDTGARKKKDLDGVVSIGDPITFPPGFRVLKNSLLASRSFDDKAGVFVLTEMMRKLIKRKLRAGVFAVSTVQEEVGLRGARTSAYAIKPEVGIAIDVDFSSDYPGIDKKRVGEESLGKGPVLHRGANINPVLEKLLIKTAKEKNIPYQLSGSPRITGTDANVMQITRAGVATAVVSIPTRYMHTPIEVVSIRDMENAVKLLVSFVTSLSGKVNFTPQEIRYQHFNLKLRIHSFQPENGPGKMDSSSIGKIITRHRGYNNVFQTQSSNCHAYTLSFSIIHRFRPSVLNSTEPAVPRAYTAENHKCRSPFTIARSPVWTAGTFTYCVQIELIKYG